MHFEFKQKKVINTYVDFPNKRAVPNKPNLTYPNIAGFLTLIAPIIFSIIPIGS